MCSIKPDQNGSKNCEKKYYYCLTSLRKTKMIFLLLQNSLSIYSVSKSAGTEFFEITTLNSQKNLQWNKRNHKMITPTSGTALSVGLSVVIFFSSFLTALSLFCFRWLSMFCCLTWVTMNFGIWRREAHWESEIWYPHYTAHHPPGKKKSIWMLLWFDYSAPVSVHGVDVDTNLAEYIKLTALFWPSPSTEDSGI